MKKVILAIVAVGLTVGLIAQMDLKKNDGSTKQVGTTAVGGTIAYFSDTETSTGNT
jgi:hypothetical protein